jgi:hypothetical protein
MAQNTQGYFHMHTNNLNQNTYTAAAPNAVEIPAPLSPDPDDVGAKMIMGNDLTMNESQLVRTIKAHLAKGDQAKDKADQHYIAAGQHLKTLKAQHVGSWAEWESFVKEKVGIGKSRAGELMQIADGTKTVAQIREGYAKADARRRQPSESLHGHGEIDDEDRNPRRSLPPQMLIESEDGRTRRATASEKAAFSDIMSRTSEPGMGAPCMRAASLDNPISNAWRDATDFNRANFARLYGDDVLRLMEEIKRADADAEGVR